MDISILSSTYDRAHELSRTLEAFCKLDVQGLQWEIIIIDNAAYPLTQQLIQNFQNRLPIQYISFPQKGKSRALNVGLPLVKGELIVFTDDDVIPKENWLKELWEGSKRWPEHSIFGGRILVERPEIIPEEFKKLKHYHLAYAIADWPMGEGPYTAYHVFGPNFAVRKKIITDEVRFNPDVGVGAFFPMGVETEFLLRLKQKGHTPVYLPKALVYHQIRSEQITLKWLYQRAFNGGRAVVFESQNYQNVKILGIPRYLIRQWISSWFQTMITDIFRKKVSRIEKREYFYRVCGQIYQYWKLKNYAKLA